MTLCFLGGERRWRPQDRFAEGLEFASERIVGCLNERDIAINVVFFQVFQHGDQQLLSRAWLIEPGETQANDAVAKGNAGEKEPWNGEFYVSLATPPAAAGTTPALRLHQRATWVGAKSSGECMQPAKEFKVMTEDGEKLAMDVVQHGAKDKAMADDPEKTEQCRQTAVRSG